MIAFILEFKLIDQNPKKQLETIKYTSPEDAVFIYNKAMEMLNIINSKFYTNTLFCCKYRIYKNVLKLLYVDLVRFYRICYYCVTESINNLKKLNLDQTKSFYQVCKSFLTLTENTQKQVGGMSSQIKEPLPVTINYFKVRNLLIDRQNLIFFLIFKNALN